MNYDIIIIGSGPGGYVAAIRASQLGFKTAIIEKENLGGICLNWGCIPTKALLKSTQIYEYVKNASKYGIELENPQVNFTKVIARSREIAQQMSKGVQFLLKKNNIEIIDGFGKLIDKNTVQITQENQKTQQITSKNIILATGASSKQIPNIQQDGKKIIGYKEALSLEKLPESMIVIGSGAIGTELASFYASMGTKITIIEFMPTIVPNEDQEVAATLTRSLKKAKIKILTSTSVETIKIEDNICKVNIKSPQGEETIESEIVLSAIGVSPNIQGIGLENLGIKTAENKILTDNFYRTNIDSIFAIGDIVKGPALAHVASAEGICCVEKIAGLNPKPIDYSIIPACTYTKPEIASIGLTEKKAIEKGYETNIGKFPYTASGKATAAGVRDGFIKLIFDKNTDTLLGAHFIGDNVTEMIAEMAVIKQYKIKATELIKIIHPHPTMSEAIMEAAAAVHNEVIHL